MPHLQLTLLVAIAVAGSAPAADRTQSAQTAILLREIRDQIDASAPAGVELYQRYFEAFPTSFEQIGEVLVSPKHREILLRPDEDWDFAQTYVALMCESYDKIDHRQYMRKMLRIGISGNDWGGRDKDTEKYLYPGDIYLRLIFRYACRQRTQEEHREQLSVIYAILPEFTDAQIEAIYNSMSWEEDTKWPLDWFLDEICSRYQKRCQLTRTLREKYAKHPTRDSHPH